MQRLLLESVSQSPCAQVIFLQKKNSELTKIKQSNERTHAMMVEVMKNFSFRLINENMKPPCKSNNNRQIKFKIVSFALTPVIAYPRTYSPDVVESRGQYIQYYQHHSG